MSYEKLCCARLFKSARRLAGVFAILYFTSTALSQQQFRAAWADIFHSGYGSQAEVNNMVNALVAGHYNVVIVQMVGYMDSLGTASHGAQYKSSILPWSSRVTAGFDPLAALCTTAHANGIEVHAWLGGSAGAMYRVSTAWPPANNATLQAHPEWFIAPLANSEGGAPVAVDGVYALDMGSPDVQEYIVSIVRELVTNYPIDGINWDDELNTTGYNAGFGYPAYPQASYARSGLARYRINTGAVGTPSNTDSGWSDYRRRFKNELMARVQAEIQSIKTNPRQPLRHSTAALAYSPVPGSCNFVGSVPYTYFCDWNGMLQNGWVDAVIPQTYSSSTFSNWASLSASCWQHNRNIFPGIGAYLQTDTTIANEILYTRSLGLKGNATYSYAVANNSSPYNGDWWAYCAANVYTDVVTTPPMPWRNPATATEGIMWGRVRNASNGLYVDDATVTVTGGPIVKTDGNGYYVATLISATASGTIHSTTASKTGYQSHTTPGAVVLAGDVVRYDFLLNFPAPTILTATGITSSAVSLTWANTVTNATGHVLARSTISGGPYTDIVSLSTNVTAYTNTGLSASTTYYYVLRGTNAYGATPNSAQVSATTQPAGVPPGIAAQPQNLSVTQGSNSTFTVSATGTPPLFYQWFFNASSISGATNSAYTRNDAQPPDAGSYSVIISNSFGTTNSASAALAVHVIPPTITQDPSSRAAVPGGWVQFTTAASGSNVVYQWQLNQINVDGATNASLVISNVLLTDFGPYQAVAANAGGSATSGVAQLTLAASPSIVTPFLDGTNFQLSFATELGPIYAVDYKLSLDDTQWIELARTNGTGNVETITDTQATNASQFYRVHLH